MELVGRIRVNHYNSDLLRRMAAQGSTFCSPTGELTITVDGYDYTMNVKLDWEQPPIPEDHYVQVRFEDGKAFCYLCPEAAMGSIVECPFGRDDRLRVGRVVEIGRRGYNGKIKTARRMAL